MRLSSVSTCALLITSVLSTAVGHAGVIQRAVALNQVGFPGVCSKFAFSPQPADSFVVERTSTGEKVFRGPMILWKAADPSTGHTVYRGDFSDLEETGQFRVITSHGDSSSVFVISDSVYNDVYRKALKGFYLQRCGTSLSATYAGAYQHPACHLPDGAFHATTDTSGTHVATGGWHDAGDYGKYVVNAGITTGTLLLAYEMYPSRFNGDNLGIPESGNGVPDILDEVRFELEWFLTMQRWDGGFWFKLTRAQFEGFVMPQSDTGTRYIYEVSSTATGDAVAVLARAARLFAVFDSAFARSCLNAAMRGWEFLSAHSGIVPAGGFRNPSGTATGEYGDGDDTDERLWAAAELFETTGDSIIHGELQRLLALRSTFDGAMSWGYVQPLGLLTYLQSKQPATLAASRNALRVSLTAFCESQTGRRNNSGYHVVLQPGDYVWGSNAVALNTAVLLLAGWEETGDTSFVTAAADQLHYMLGANGLSRSYLTGVGENPPLYPHHRPSASDGVSAPVPGLLAGGPDQYRDDDALRARFTSATPPALCYLDTLPSYASNEIAINWNAPLVFVAGYFKEVSIPTEVGWEEERAPDGIVLEHAKPNPFNPTTMIRYGVPKSAHVTLTIFNSLGQQVARLVDGEKDAGYHEVKLDGRDLSTGAYFCRLQSGDFVQTKRLLLIR